MGEGNTMIIEYVHNAKGLDYYLATMRAPNGRLILAEGYSRVDAMLDVIVMFERHLQGETLWNVTPV